MAETKAIYYGQVHLVPGITCDGYILDNDIAVMSERGTAKLLGIDQKLINRMRTNGSPKSLEPFIDEGFSMRTNLVKVMHNKSPHYGTKILVHTSLVIETLIRAYVLAYAHNKLRKNQQHIGQRCTVLLTILVKTALDSAIKEACGFTTDIQQTSQKYYQNSIRLLTQMGFKCSANNEVATKKDIINFLKVPLGTLNSFLYKHNKEIQALKLDNKTIHSVGSRARRMNGYHIKDVVKISFGMDTAVGIELKQRIFGETAPLMQMTVKDEVQWRKVLSEVFSGYDLRYNHSIGSHRIRVDFFIVDLMLCLECNEYAHRNYNPEWEEKREQIITENYSLIRFHHKITLQKLFNGILRVKPREILYLGK